MKARFGLLICYGFASLMLLIPLIAACEAFINPRFERHHWLLGSYICGIAFLIARGVALLIPHASSSKD